MLFGYILLYAEHRTIALVREAQTLDGIRNNLVVIRVVGEHPTVAPIDEAQILMIGHQAAATCKNICPRMRLRSSGLVSTQTVLQIDVAGDIEALGISGAHEYDGL